MTTLTRMSDLTSSIRKAFKDQVEEALTKELEKAIEDYQKNIPTLIARVADLIDVQLVQSASNYGIEVRFVIVDINEIKQRIKTL